MHYWELQGTTALVPGVFCAAQHRHNVSHMPRMLRLRNVQDKEKESKGSEQNWTDHTLYTTAYTAAAERKARHPKHYVAETEKIITNCTRKHERIGRRTNSATNTDTYTHNRGTRRCDT